MKLLSPAVNNSTGPKLIAFAVLALVIACCSFAQAQQTLKTARVGYLTAGATRDDPGFVAFREGMRDFGYTEGQNVVIEFRSAETKFDRIPRLISELIDLNIDVLVSSSQPGTRAAKAATNTVPIVMIASFDPVATGVVASLARPGGNITGVARLQRELGGKRLEVLKDAIPRITRVGVLWNPDSPGPAQVYKEYETAARGLRIQLLSLEIPSSSPDF